ncbi:MAG: hypothetical protein Q4C59_04665 [Lachnospiraceae bacterium]|nr:hypothetical protein [Lachnospiraceae bacterium]
MNIEAVTVRDQWFEVFEERQKECDRKLAAAEKEKKQLEKRVLRAEHQRDGALEKVTEQRCRIYELETELEEEKGKNGQEAGRAAGTKGSAEKNRRRLWPHPAATAARVKYPDACIAASLMPRMLASGSLTIIPGSVNAGMRIFLPVSWMR